MQGSGFCRSCGAPAVHKGAFCVRCGAALPSAKAPAPLPPNALPQTRLGAANAALQPGQTQPVYGHVASGWPEQPSGWATPRAWTPGVGWQSGYAPYPSRRTPRGILVSLGVVLVLACGLAVGGLAAVWSTSPLKQVAALPRPSPTPSTTPSPSPTPLPTPSPSPAPVNKFVFRDDFSDPNSGWFSGRSSNGTDYEYTARGYTISNSTKVSTRYAVDSPYQEQLGGLSITATGAISEGAQSDGGFGVGCRRGGDSAERFEYEFELYASGNWYINLRTGAPSMTNVPTYLRSGTAPVYASETPVTITATCQTQADGANTELNFVIDGTTVADLTDTAMSLPDNGWVGAVDAILAPPKATVTVSYFEERDVSLTPNLPVPTGGVSL